MSDYKIVFIGSPGAGKSTSIRSISDLPPVSTEVPASDESRDTTVALDFGEMTLDDGEVVRLYGVPGQGRFDFIWPLIADGAMGAIFFLDARDPTPLKVLDGYIDSFSALVANGASVLAVSHGDHANPRPDLAAYARHLRGRGLDMPVVEIDPRQRRDVLYALNMLISLLERDNMEAAHGA